MDCLSLGLSIDERELRLLFLFLELRHFKDGIEIFVLIFGQNVSQIVNFLLHLCFGQLIILVELIDLK